MSQTSSSNQSHRVAVNVVEDDEVRATPSLYKAVEECNKRIEAQEAKNEQIIQLIRLLFEALDRHTLASH